jgi:hypothetical protein
MARRQRHDGEGRAFVGEVLVFIVFVGRAGVPAAAEALVGLEPIDAFAKLRLFGRQAALAQRKDGESGAVAVARLSISRISVRTLPIAQRGKGPGPPWSGSEPSASSKQHPEPD